jgi:hypothetical protein
MDWFKRVIAILLAFACVNLIFVETVYAYVDPGTGSYILQLILASVFGGLFAIKLFWKRLKGFCTDLFHKRKRHAKPAG